jgi:hypothetical protein
MLEAVHTRPRLVLASHPVEPRWDAFWVVAGRVADWGPLPGTAAEIEQRTTAALTRRAEAVVPAAEVDEVRIVRSWIARNDPAVLELDDVSPAKAAHWAKATTGSEDAVASPA